MSKSFSVSRRSFLYGAGLSAAATVISACSSKSKGGNSTTSDNSGGSSSGGSSTAPAKIGGTVGSASKPLPKPSSFNESPALKGKGLPAVEDRLPAEPYVVPHNWVSRGKYGGTLNTTVFGTTGAANANSIREYCYGFSPTRWLNDGLDIGPGCADKWTSNAKATEWTIHFREGLKWSDGQPFSVDDVLFWYYDMAKPGHNAQTIPPDCLSAKGTPCTMTKGADDSTLKISYDAPQPLIPDYLAAWVKGNIGGVHGNGPVWMYPKHYLKQFHPKYNPSVEKSWDQAGGLWEHKADWMQNPDCPTLTGFKCKSFDNNKGVTLERNPYYWVVTKDGDQLPYLDTIQFTVQQNAQAIKLQAQQGSIDFLHGVDNQVDLSDVSTLSKTADSGNYEILLWDSGDGTGSIFYLNYDYIAQDKKYGELFRDKRFRQAISFAFDRKTCNRVLYFQYGEITTGTMSPKAIEFQVNATGKKLYAQWRDSYKNHDVAKAKSLLAEIGLKDTDGDGYVEFPDGSKLVVEIPYSADIADTQAAKDDQLVSNAKEVGLKMVRKPIAPNAWTDSWNNGHLMSHSNWGVGDGPNCLVYPQWIVPLEPSRWAPLEGNWNLLTGTSKQKSEANLKPIDRHPPRMPPSGPVAKLTDLYNQTKLEPDEMKRHQLVWEMFKVHIEDGPFFMGPTANYPQVNVCKKDLKNVPRTKNLALHGFDGPWVVPSPAVYDPECWYWDNPDEHKG
ncbi:MAG TPA: ABC transporter substrate-binding protein [Mycobacteriales bacterium]|nr:ABC transporter substrate-binding protein [Mycobacteriales bacterium]